MIIMVSSTEGITRGRVGTRRCVLQSLCGSVSPLYLIIKSFTNKLWILCSPWPQSHLCNCTTWSYFPVVLPVTHLLFRQPSLVTREVVRGIHRRRDPTRKRNESHSHSPPFWVTIQLSLVARITPSRRRWLADSSVSTRDSLLVNKTQ